MEVQSDKHISIDKSPFHDYSFAVCDVLFLEAGWLALRIEVIDCLRVDKALHATCGETLVRVTCYFLRLR